MSDEKTAIMRESSLITRKENCTTSDILVEQGNMVSLRGKLEANFEFSHQLFKEKFYKTRIIVKRKCPKEDSVDYIPLLVSDSFLSSDILAQNLKDKWVDVTGRFRSYNRIKVGGSSHLVLYVYPTELSIYDTEPEYITFNNYIYLEGYICKVPVYRITPLGKEITDLLIAVNRPFGKSDYIPCIAWYKNARFAAGLGVGNKVKIYGLVQSRKYFKKINEDSEEVEVKETYEISIKNIDT